MGRCASVHVKLYLCVSLCVTECARLCVKRQRGPMCDDVCFVRGGFLMRVIVAVRACMREIVWPGCAWKKVIFVGFLSAV